MLSLGTGTAFADLIFLGPVSLSGENIEVLNTVLSVHSRVV